MGKTYLKYCLLLTGGLLFSMLVISCKKDSNSKPDAKAAPIATLGLYELQGTIYRRVIIPVQIGNVKATFYSIFDTGSSAMTLDADSLIPKSMITNAGISIPGDSLVINGITVTKQTATLNYGDATSSIKEYGNLAYAVVKIGDANGSVTTKRIPFFLYYKAVDTETGEELEPHANDIFGVGPNTRFGNLAIASPLSYFDMPANVTQGFVLAKFNKTLFSTNGTYVSNLLTIGLTSDVLNSSGFVMHNLTPSSTGYLPDIPAKITYNGRSIQGTLLFDTGTPAFSTIEDPAATKNQTTLPANSSVTITTSAGFTYQYTTTSDYNLTQIDNPSYTNDPRTIFSIDFFADNQFLLDYTSHRIGLKN